MATSGNAEEEEFLISGHETVFDWTCGQCENDGHTSEATAYCQDCDDGFCDACLKIHQRFPAMKNHKVLDNAQTCNWGQGAVVRGSGFPCYDHDDQTISMYCGDHDVVCCAVCVALDHKGCDHIVYIPKMSKGVVKSQEFIKTQTDINEMIAKTKKTMDEAKKGSEELDSSRGEAVEAIYEAKQDVIEHFDKLEDEAIAVIDKLHEKRQTESREMVSACSSVCQELEAIRQQSKSDSSVSDSGAFVLMKMGQKKVSECQSVGKKLFDAMSAGIFKIAFQANPGLQSTKEITVIGQVENDEKESVYSLYGLYECEVNTPNDKYYIVVSGMYQLSNGNFLLSDQANNALKLLSSTYKLIDCCQLPGPPSQISSTYKTDPTELAVGLLNGSLQFLSVTSKIKLTRRITLKHKCNGLLFRDWRVYISDLSQKVYIYAFVDKKLTHLKTVKKYEDNICLFLCTQDISSDGGTGGIFVADQYKGIVSLDLDGNHQQTLKHSDVLGFVKAVSDTHGNIFVLQGLKGVIQLGGHGKTVIGLVDTEAEYFYLDTSNSVLYVWCPRAPDGNPHFKIFKRK